MSRNVVVMEVSALTVDPITGLPAVLLVPVAPGSRAVPITVSIGLGEASAIATELRGIELERPSTHQLMSALLADAGAQVERIEIYDIVDGRYRVRIHLCLPDGSHTARDSRPSDALALALHTQAPIEVVTLERAAVLDGVPPHGHGERHPSRRRCDDQQQWERELSELPELRDLSDLPDLPDLPDLNDVSDEAFGKWKM